MTLTPPRRLALGREIVPVNYIAVAVERRLAGDEDDAARGHFYDLRVTGRRSSSGGLMRVIIRASLFSSRFEAAASAASTAPAARRVKAPTTRSGCGCP